MSLDSTSLRALVHDSIPRELEPVRRPFDAQYWACWAITIPAVPLLVALFSGRI